MDDNSAPGPRVAAPGDPDLDLDVDGVTITSVVRAGHEIWVGAAGGSGTWASGPHGEMEPVAVVTELNVVVGYPTAGEVQIAAVYDLLCSWRDRAVPLRLCAAPGALSVLIEDASRWLPLPRSPHPSPRHS